MTAKDPIDELFTLTQPTDNFWSEQELKDMQNISRITLDNLIHRANTLGMASTRTLGCIILQMHMTLVERVARVDAYHAMTMATTTAASTLDFAEGLTDMIAGLKEQADNEVVK